MQRRERSTYKIMGLWLTNITIGYLEGKDLPFVTMKRIIYDYEF